MKTPGYFIFTFFLILFTAALQAQNTDAFITTWQVSNGGNILIPVNPGVSGYNYTVDWGDGSISTNQNGDASHTYATSGIYTVSITGNFPAIKFGNHSSTNARKLRTIEQWGTQEWQGMANAFRGCSNLTTESDSDAPIFAPNSSLAQMFNGCSKFNSDLNDWNLTNVRSTSFMFMWANNFNGNVSKVTDMTRMFDNVSKFNQDIGGWDVSKVIDMSFMFQGASAFNQDIGDWEVFNVTRMENMFNNATNFNRDIGSWVVSNVTDMTYMFYNAIKFDQNIGGWNVTSVTSMTNMLSNSGLSTVNYDNTLIGWSAQTVKPNINLGAAELKYCAAVEERQSLIDDHGWTISGDAVESMTCNPVATVISVEEPDDITAECPTLFSDLILPGMIEVTYDDNSTKEVSVTWQEGNYDPSVGQYVLTGNLDLTADENPNNLAGEITIIVEDNVAPVADNQTLADFTAQCQVTANVLTAPTATDNCSGQITGTTNATFPITTHGTTTITWTYEDNAGNQSTQDQDIVINDNIDPVPDNQTLTDFTAQCQVTASDLTAPKATDNCSGPVTGTLGVPVTLYHIDASGMSIAIDTRNSGKWQGQYGSVFFTPVLSGSYRIKVDLPDGYAVVHPDSLIHTDGWSDTITIAGDSTLNIGTILLVRDTVSKNPPIASERSTADQSITSRGLDFKVYPNPSSGRFKIKLPETGRYDYTIFSHLGQRVKFGSTENGSEIDMTGKKDGVYYIRVEKDNIYSDTRAVLLFSN